MTPANDSRMSWPWFECRPRFVLAAALCVAAVLLVGCAESPYWIKDWPPLAVTRIEYSDRVACRDGSYYGDLGCTDRLTGVIRIQAGMSTQLTECVLRHELAHMRGWSHLDNQPQFPISCGPTEE